MTKPTEEVAPRVSSADEKTRQPPLKRFRLLVQLLLPLTLLTVNLFRTLLTARPMHRMTDYTFGL